MLASPGPSPRDAEMQLQKETPEVVVADDGLEDEEGLTPHALAIWSDACRSAGLSPYAATCGIVSISEAVTNRAGGSKEDLACVGAVLWDLTGGNSEVTRHQYALFLQYFGSVLRCIDKVRDVMTRPWFHGNQSREDSEEALRRQGLHEKTFLLRYSSNVGAFTVDYVKAAKLCHFNNIRNDPDGGIEVVVGRPPEQQVYKYSNLSTFIIKNQHIFGEPCINPASEFHKLRQRLASPDSFSNLYEFLGLRPPTPSHRASRSDSGNVRVLRSKPSKESPSSSQEKATRLPDKLDKQANKERSKTKKKHSKKEKKPKDKSEGKKSWSSDTSDVFLRIKQSLELALKASRPSLDLRSMSIGPDLPPAVCELNNLVSLDLSHNNLIDLPDALGQLERLETLDLSDNKLTSLNPNIFNSNMRKLASLICADNLLTSIPETLFEGHAVASLVHLDLSCNQLTAVPKALAKLKYKLQFLDLSMNAIEKLPTSVTKLMYLEEFYIKGNKLRQLPRKMSSMISLMVLDLADNQLSEIPDDLFVLARSMPGFVLIASGNLMDSKAIEARIAQNQKSSPQFQSVQDLFDVYKFGLKFDRSDNNLGAIKNQVSLTIPKSNVSDGGLTPRRRTDSSRDSKSRLNPDSLHISYLPSLWVGTDGYRLERSIDADASEAQEPKLVLYDHITIFDYRRFFYMKSVHANIIGHEKRLGPVCVSIQKDLKEIEPEDPDNENQSKAPSTYRALIRTPQGDRVTEIPSSSVKLHKKERYARSNDLLHAMKKHLETHHKLQFSISNLYVIRDASSHDAFAELEDKLKVNSFKFGVLYAKDGQDETAMYNNQEGSPGFINFLELLGEKIQLEGWTKYAAGLDTSRSGHAVYTVFREHEMMFHVSTYLPYRQRTDELGQQWERKQHIGNDVVVIVYYEGTTPLDPSIFESQFNHVFALVQPIPGSNPVSYRLHMAYKEGVSSLTDVRPPLPPRATFQHGPAFREFLLTKLINAERCAMGAERFLKPVQRLRSILFGELQTRFPKATQGITQKGHHFSLRHGKRKMSKTPTSGAQQEYYSVNGSPISPGRMEQSGQTDQLALGYFPLSTLDSFDQEDTSVEYMTPDMVARVARQLNKS